MSILSDIDITLNKADVFLGCKNEIDSLNKNCTSYMTVKTDSCHYAILKRLNNKKKFRHTIYANNWGCSNILKYYGMDQVFKDITIVLESYSPERTTSYRQTNLCLIFRGHKRKNDYVVVLKSFCTFHDFATHAIRCEAKLRNWLSSSYEFNDTMNSMLVTLKLPTARLEF